MKTTEELLAALNFLNEKDLKEAIIENSKVLTFNKGDVIVREGEYVKVLPIVIEGSIRVFQANEEREILLYYVESGQTCMMSLSACFFNNESPSIAIAAEESTIFAIPTKFIVKWQKEYKSWNDYIIRTFRKRYDELLFTFEGVAFEHIDKRILDYLSSRKDKNNSDIIEISHQNLANELGTTRVVISRILKQFELNGKVKLHRKGIELF